MTAEPTNSANERPDGNDEPVDVGDIGAEDPETDNAVSAHDQRLFALASRIDQGHAIDWDAAEREATDDRERAIIAEMRLLADVARVGREHALVADADDEAARQALERLRRAQTEGDRGDAFEYDPPAPPAMWGSLTIHEPIGRGAFATVYRAQDNLGRLVALKLFPLPPELMIDWAARLLREGRLLARVRHENVVTIFGADQGDGYVGLWMEFVKGRTLEDELHTRVRFGADEAVQVGRVLCRALAAVHREGLLHRDVKAHNVMRDETGRIVLMDFGSGREATVEEPRAGAGLDLVGTPLYLAPEVFAGQPASVASDIYSLGVLLFHLVSDRYPVEGANRAEIQEAHRQRRRVWLRDARPDLPDAFVSLVERALSADRTQRYQSAGEFEDALAGIARPAQVSQVPQVGNEEPKPKAPSRSRWPLIAAATSALLAAMILLAVTWPRLFISTPASVADAGVAKSSPGSPAAGSTPTATSAATPAPASGTYDVQAAFFKRTADGRVPLTTGDRISPHDRLGLRVQLSKPAYVYVANRDENGDAFVMYPMRDPPTPLAPGREHRLPEDETGDFWQVTSPGGREHFVVFVTPEPMRDLDQLLRDVPRVAAGRPVTSTQIPKSRMEGLPRGVGGLVRADATTKSSVLDRLFNRATPLQSEQETVEGEWVRKLILVNPPGNNRR
jgi:serine/threonine protein kinase